MFIDICLQFYRSLQYLFHPNLRCKLQEKIASCDSAFTLAEKLPLDLTFRISVLQQNLNVDNDLTWAKEIMRTRPNTCFFVALLFATSCIPVGIFVAFVFGTFMFLFVCFLAVQCSVVGVGLTALTFALSGPLCVASLFTLLVYLLQRFVSCLQYGGGLVTSLPRNRWGNFLRMGRHADGFIRCLGPQYNSLASFISGPTLQRSSGMNIDPTEVDGTFEDGSRVEGTER